MQGILSRVGWLVTAATMPILYTMDSNMQSHPSRSLSQRARWIIIAALGVGILLAARLMTQRPAADIDPVTAIESIDQLAAAFNADAGRPRIILLFSPT
jgi:hypothetical protein